jgi:hypothetical protein
VIIISGFDCIRYSECVSVAADSRHAVRTRAMLYCHLWSVRFQLFSHIYLINCTIFVKKVNAKLCFDFLFKLCLKCDVHVTVHRRHSEGKEPTRCDKHVSGEQSIPGKPPGLCSAGLLGVVDGRLGSRLRGYHPVAPRPSRYGPFVHRL